jgi:DDE superfamily endonuclease
VRLHPETKVVVDSGYQGLQRAHTKTDMPRKRSKKNPLSMSDRARNRDISSERVPCENVIAMLKRFKIIARLSLTVTEIVAAASACASSSSPPSTTWNSKSHDSYARGLLFVGKTVIAISIVGDGHTRSLCAESQAK